MQIQDSIPVEDSSFLSSLPSRFDDSSVLSSAPSYSDASSELSQPPSRLSTPSPEDFAMSQTTTPMKLDNKRHTQLISPPRSQDSSRASPCPDAPSSGTSSSAEDGEPPRKRRRVTPTMPRETKRLDLRKVKNAEQKLKDPEQQAELDRLLKALRTKKKVVVVAGAGISVSAGIPDFRSSDGLFRSLKSQNNMKSSGKELFSANVYRDDHATAQFHNMVRTLHQDTAAAHPTPFHHLIARLAAEDRLLRLYTQNVDGIDTSLPPLATQVPLPRKGPWPKTIQLHGGLSKMVCTKCSSLTDFQPDLFDGPQAPDCEKCEEADYARTEVAGKRSHGVGKLRPRMVLYDEQNPDDEAIGMCSKADWRRRPDCIIVVGTTLKIPGVRRIVQETCKIVKDHRHGLSVWINNDSEPPSTHGDELWDIIVKGTSDQIATHAKMGKWDDEDLQEVPSLSQEDVDRVKERSDLQVVVESPTKRTPFKDVGDLPSPIESPNFKLDKDSAPATEETTKPQKPMPRMSTTPAWFNTVLNDYAPSNPLMSAAAPSSAPPPARSITNPASKGRKLDKVLGPVTQKGTAKAQPKPKASATSTAVSQAGPATKAAPAKAPPKSKKAAPKKKAEPAAKNGQLNFQITKGNENLKVPTKNAKAPKDSKPTTADPVKPLNASPTRENMPGPPPKPTLKRPRWMGKETKS